MNSLNLKHHHFCFLLLAFSFLLFTGMQCKKTSDTTKKEVLPAETQTGKQTFGCLVNGQVWLPKGKSLQPGLTASIQFDILNLSASKGDEFIGIGIRNLNGTGSYNLVDFDSLYAKGDSVYNRISGVVLITRYDTVNQILSGTFNFKASNDKDIINITEGRFDIVFTK